MCAARRQVRAQRKGLRCGSSPTLASPTAAPSERHARRCLPGAAQPAGAQATRCQSASSRLRPTHLEDLALHGPQLASQRLLLAPHVLGSFRLGRQLGVLLGQPALEPAADAGGGSLSAAGLVGAGWCWVVLVIAGRCSDAVWLQAWSVMAAAIAVQCSPVQPPMQRIPHLAASASASRRCCSRRCTSCLARSSASACSCAACAGLMMTPLPSCS